MLSLQNSFVLQVILHYWLVITLTTWNYNFVHTLYCVNIRWTVPLSPHGELPLTFLFPATDFPLFRSLLNVCLHWLIDLLPTLFPGSQLFSFTPGGGRKRDPGTEVGIELVLACYSKTDITHKYIPFWLLCIFSISDLVMVPQKIPWRTSRDLNWENKTFKLKGLF